MKTCVLTGIRRTGALLASNVKNLWSGLKLILFLRSDARGFSFTPANLWSVAALLLVTKYALDYLSTEKPAEFYPYGFPASTLYLLLTLLAGFICSAIAGRRFVQLSFPIVFMNAIWIPMIPYAVFVNPQMQPGKTYGNLCNITFAGIFFIALRSMMVTVPRQAQRQIAGAVASTALLYTVFAHYHFPSFWFKQEIEEVESGPSLMPEDVLPEQFQLLDKQLDAIAPRRKGRNYFTVTYGSDDAQDVFMKEAIFARNLFEKKFNAKGRIITLINNPKLLKEFPAASINGIGRIFEYLSAKSAEKEGTVPPRPQYPLATVTNLTRTLAALGKKADPEEDVLILYITSHGGQNGIISVELGDVPLYQLTEKKLKEAIDGSGFKWKVILISACFSGSFVDALKDDYSIIITSSREDRVSYGCGTDFDLTFFGKALLEEALSKTDSFITAFELARENIEHREEDEPFVAKRSQPQLYVGRHAKEYLK